MKLFIKERSKVLKINKKHLGQDIFGDKDHGEKLKAQEYYELLISCVKNWKSSHSSKHIEFYQLWVLLQRTEGKDPEKEKLLLINELANYITEDYSEFQILCKDIFKSTIQSRNSLDEEQSEKIARSIRSDASFITGITLGNILDIQTRKKFKLPEISNSLDGFLADKALLNKNNIQFPEFCKKWGIFIEEDPIIEDSPPISEPIKKEAPVAPKMIRKEDPHIRKSSKIDIVEVEEIKPPSPPPQLTQSKLVIPPLLSSNKKSIDVPQRSEILPPQKIILESVDEKITPAKLGKGLLKKTTFQTAQRPQTSKLFISTQKLKEYQADYIKENTYLARKITELELELERVQLSARQNLAPQKTKKSTDYSEKRMQIIPADYFFLRNNSREELTVLIGLSRRIGRFRVFFKRAIWFKMIGL